MALTDINQLYLQYLQKYPLVTKSVTSGVLNGLNEILASHVTKDSATASEFKSKVIKMVIYGSFLLTPLSHTLYGILHKLFDKLSGGKPLTAKLKLLQVLASLSTITPILCGLFTAWTSLINNYSSGDQAFANPVEKLGQEITRMKRVIKNGLHLNYGRILKSSLITSGVSLVIAQNYIAPELWVVFFNAIYFVLGTYQNIKQKQASKDAQQESKKKPKQQ